VHEHVTSATPEQLRAIFDCDMSPNGLQKFLSEACKDREHVESPFVRAFAQLVGVDVTIIVVTKPFPNRHDFSNRKTYKYFTPDPKGPKHTPEDPNTTLQLALVHSGSRGHWTWIS
jgi:hypothetical protein